MPLPEPGSASLCHQVLAQRGSFDCWVFSLLLQSLYLTVLEELLNLTELN